MWASDVQLLAVVDTADEDRAVKKRGSIHHVEVAVRVVVPGGSGVGWSDVQLLAEVAPQMKTVPSKSVVQRCGCVRRCPGSGCTWASDRLSSLRPPQMMTVSSSVVQPR
jgi:hypothetical protein